MRDRTTGTEDNADQRPLTPEWRKKLTGWLVAFFSGMVITDVSITLGYRGRAGVSAIAAVVAVTLLVRRLDARAPLRRYAVWPLMTLQPWRRRSLPLAGGRALALRPL